MIFSDRDTSIRCASCFPTQSLGAISNVSYLTIFEGYGALIVLIHQLSGFDPSVWHIFQVAQVLRLFR